MRLTLGQCNPQKRYSPSVTRWHTHTLFSMSFTSCYYILLQVGSIRKTGHHMWSLHDLAHARRMLYFSISSPFSHCVFWQVVFNFSSLASAALQPRQLESVVLWPQPPMNLGWLICVIVTLYPFPSHCCTWGLCSLHLQPLALTVAHTKSIKKTLTCASPFPRRALGAYWDQEGENEP